MISSRRKRKPDLTAIRRALKPKQPVIEKVKELVTYRVQYREWRKAVLARDGYRCRWCGRKGSKQVRLQADHILPRAARPDLTFVVSNGRTLCRRCHKTTPTWGRKAARYKGIV